MNSEVYENHKFLNSSLYMFLIQEIINFDKGLLAYSTMYPKQHEI